MKNTTTDHLKFYVTFHPAMLGLPAETAGVLYVANTKDNSLHWFDNQNREWHGSIYGYSDIKSDEDFKEVKEWDNGYISTSAAMEEFGEELGDSIEN